MVATSDELGRTTRYEYDSRGRPVRMTDPLGGVTRFEYDANNNLVALTDPEGNRTSFAYDSRDRRITEVDPLGNVTRFVYDAANQLRRIVDRLGRVTQYDYNELAQMVGETWKDAAGAVTNEIVYAHDLVGNLLSAEDDFSAIAFAYDNRYRVKTADNTGTPLGAPEVVLTYAYSDTGTRSSVVEAIGGTTQATVAYTYDRLDRMTKVTQSGGNSTAKRVDFGYNALGQWTAISRYSNLSGTALVATSSFTYDSKNRLQTLYHRDSANAVLAKYLYEYNRADEIIQLEDIDGTATYSYDLFGQLTGGEHTNASNPDEAYDYDLNGNRESSHRHGTDYVTGLNNRLLSDGDYAYEYDLEGNLLRRTAIATGAYRVLAWDNRNRLTAVRDYNASDVLQRETAFTYDALGRRISKSFDDFTDSVDEVLTHFVYDGANVVLDFVDDDGAGGSGTAVLAKRYLHGPAINQVLAQEDAGGVHWLLADHQGSIKDIVDSSGAIEEHRILDAFGNIISPTNPIIEVRYAFTGRELDPETGLYYYRARYYDATNGRFISEDPIGFAAGDVNPSRYVHNMPTSRIDPSGNFSLNPFKWVPDWVYTPIHSWNNWNDEWTLNEREKALRISATCPDVQDILFADSRPNIDSLVQLLQDAANGVAGQWGGAFGMAGAPFTLNQSALISLAKEMKRRGGITRGQGRIFKTWCNEYGIKFRGPESHINRGFGKHPHYHIGPVDHIPAK